MAKIITIDGPAGSGKGSLARALAAHLGIPHLDTGLIYRYIAWHLRQNGKDPSEVAEITAAADRFAALYRDSIRQKNPDFLDNSQLPIRELTSSAIGQATSKMAVQSHVRQIVTEKCREIARNSDRGIIADGRDAGSVIFADADHKFYLTASPSARAHRRYSEQKETDASLNIAEIEEHLKARDERDISRKNAPLSVPSGAIVIDNTDLTIAQTLQEALNYL